MLALVDEKLQRVARHAPVDIAVRRKAERHEQRADALPGVRPAALHGIVHELPQQRHEQQQTERARERSSCPAQPAEDGPTRAGKVERRGRQQQKQALAHGRGEEKAPRREHEKPQRAHGAAVRQVEPQQPVDHAPRAREAQRRCEQPRADVGRNEPHHRAHHERIARQEHELHDAVGVAGGDVAVARDVEIVPAVEAAPEFERLRERLRPSGEGADAPCEQEQDEIEREQRSENACAHVHGFGCRDSGGRSVRPLPEAHPHGHEPQPHGGEQRRAAPGGDAARNGQARRAHAPEHEQHRERGKAQRIERDDGAAGSRLHGGTS